jgi:glycine C-acetyltransferase
MEVTTRLQSQVQGDASDYDYSSFYYSSSDDVLDILEPYTEWYDKAQLRGYYLYGQPMSSRPMTRVELQEKLEQRRLNLLNLSSYNYLGLSYRPEVVDACKRALDRYGMGAAGSPVLSGTMDVHMELERELAAYKNKPACLLFPTGYSTNVGLIQGIMRPGDLILADQNSHASIVDGAILSKAELRFFKHNRPDELEKKLKAARSRTLVCVEGVSSMDGDVCRLPEIVEIARKYDARIMIDEAHSTFIYGENGRGVAEAFGLEDQIDIHVGTLSKALGGQGGFVAGSTSLYKYLEGFARSRFFSCALSPVVAAGLLEALRIASREPGLRGRLWANVAHIRRLLREEGIDVGESTSQVIPVMIRNDRRIFEIAHRLQRAGLYLQPIVHPAVAKHRSRFRISVSAAHTHDQLNEGVAILAHVLREEGIL